MVKDNPYDKPAKLGNEGEGNRTAAKQYDDAASKFAHSGKVGPAASEAEKALEGPEGKDLRKAEEAGKRRAAEEDPLLRK